MSEFDIRIGTLLDTSQAEEQLQNFINKYSGDNDFKINLKISGDEKLEGIEKSLTNIKNLAKSIGNIKMDFDGGGVNVDTAFNKTIEKAKKEIEAEFRAETRGEIRRVIHNVSYSDEETRLLESVAYIKEDIAEEKEIEICRNESSAAESLQ